jgi:hypothetical protein
VGLRGFTDCELFVLTSDSVCDVLVTSGRTVSCRGELSREVHCRGELSDDNGVSGFGGANDETTVLTTFGCWPLQCKPATPARAFFFWDTCSIVLRKVGREGSKPQNK